MGQSAARRHEEIRALQHGIELGMNLVDTAEMYDNEELVLFHCPVEAAAPPIRYSITSATGA